jgi:hypothetical protein
MQLSPSAACPSDCGCPSEDDDHLLRCPRAERCALYQKLVTDLRKLFNTYHVDPWLRQILLSKIAAVHPSTHFNLTALTPPYRDLALQQAGLGHSSLFYGYFHQGWILLQDAYLRSQHKPTERNQSRQAVEKIAMHFQAIARAQWDTRNQHLHESQDDGLPFARALAIQETTLIYEHLPLLLLLDRPAITNGIPLSDRLAYSTKRLQHWLRRIRPLFLFLRRQAKKRPPHTADIRSFFHHVRPPETPRYPAES